jgi:AcrR family transcriptional regulator
MTSTDTRSTAERILETAERLFAIQGYHGVSIREIAKESDVALNLVRYHFGSKDDLFRAVTNHRLQAMCSIFISSLESAQRAAKDGEPLDVRGIVSAYAYALERMNAEGPGWNHYLRLIIQADLLVDRPELLRHMRETYAPVFDRYVEAFQASGMTNADAYWAIYFMHTATAQLTLQIYSISHLSDGVADPTDHEQLLSRLVEFMTVGLQASTRP